MTLLKLASPRLERGPYVIGKVSALAFVTSCKWFGLRAYCFTCFKRLLNSSIKAVLVNISSVITRYILIHSQKPPNWTSIPVKEQSTSCIAKILLFRLKKTKLVLISTNFHTKKRKRWPPSTTCDYCQSLTSIQQIILHRFLLCWTGTCHKNCKQLLQ